MPDLVLWLEEAFKSLWPRFLFLIAQVTVCPCIPSPQLCCDGSVSAQEDGSPQQRVGVTCWTPSNVCVLLGLSICHMTLLHLVQDVETGLELLEEKAPGGHFTDDRCNCWHVWRVYYLSLFWCLLKAAPQGCQAPPSPMADVGILHSMVEVGDERCDLIDCQQEG